MNKFLHLVCAVAFLFLTPYALLSQVRLGAKGGLNVAKVNYRVFPGIEPKMTASFQVGGVAEFALPVDVLFLNVGLEFQGKGYQYVIDSTAHTLSVSVNPFYIQVPVNLIVRSADGGMYAGIGPYLAYGITGKVKEVDKIAIDGQKTETENNVLFGNTNTDHFRPFDYGVSLELGYETPSGIRITGAYSWGLGDNRKDAIKDTKFISPVNHRVASLSITYFFTTLK